jgi:hypothetical protein
MADEAVIKIPSGEVLEDDEASTPPISLPDSGDTGEGGKLNMIVQLVKKCLGVKDIAAMYISHSAPFTRATDLLNQGAYHFLLLS